MLLVLLQMLVEALMSVALLIFWPIIELQDLIEPPLKDPQYRLCLIMVTLRTNEDTPANINKFFSKRKHSQTGRNVCLFLLPLNMKFCVVFLSSVDVVIVHQRRKFLYPWSDFTWNRASWGVCKKFSKDNFDMSIRLLDEDERCSFFESTKPRLHPFAIIKERQELPIMLFLDL